MPPETTASAGNRGREIPLRVNGEALHVSDACSLDALLRQLDLDRRRIAVAVNRSVVPRSAFATHRLCAGDRVEILEAVGGG